MTGFPSVVAYANSLIERTRYAGWRKAPTQVTTVGVWFDLSMSPGTPVPQYYAAAPLATTRLSRSTDGGLDHGTDAPAGMRKALARMTIMSNSATGLPCPLILCDYLLFIPFVDEGTTDPQIVNQTTTLPRYPTGEGVQIMAVSVAGRTGGQSFTIGYTNSQGIPGRSTVAAIQNSVSLNGSIVTSERALAGAVGPFLALQRGDTGVRSIDDVTMLGVDVGLFALVLVKPLAQLHLREQTAPVEANYLTDYAQVPQIENDAYLNLLVCPAASLAATVLSGDILTTWN